MPTADDINRVLRDFVRFSGDGKPNAPAGAPLPIGDPRSGIHDPSKRELRDVLLAILQAMGNPEALETLIGELRTRRIASTANSNFSGTTFPPGAETVVFRNASNTHIWQLLSTAPIPVVSGKHQQDAQGGWWERVFQVLDTTPTFANRAAAEAGAPGLPTSVTQMFVTEGTALVVRSRTAFADDPLFASGARWGVTLRQDLGSVASLAAPVLVSVAGTANAITASLPASAISAGLTGSSVGVVEFVPASINTTITPTLMIAGDTTTRSIVRMDGTTLAIGDIQAGRAMRLMRFGAQFRVLSRLPSEEQLSINAALQKTIAVDAASSAALRSLDAAGFVTFPLQVSFAAGTTLSGLPAGALMVVPASGSRFWTALEGGVLVQNYQEGSNVWRRERSGNVWLSWQVISLVVVGSNLSAANRNFDGVLLLTPGVSYVMDGSGAILNGPDGTQSYIGRSETDRVSGQVRQRIWLNGDVSPLTRVGGVSGSWVRSAPGLDGAMIVFPGDSETFGVGTANAATDAFPVVAARKLGCAYLKLGTAGAQMDSTTAATQAQKDGSFVETVNANIATIGKRDVAALCGEA